MLRESELDRLADVLDAFAPTRLVAMRWPPGRSAAVRCIVPVPWPV